MARHTALLFHSGRKLRVHEVQRHLHVDLLVLGYTLEIDVRDLQLERVHVEGAQQHLLLAAFEVEREDGGVKGLHFQLLIEILVLELDVDRGLGAAVHDAGYASRNAQTAARTRSLHLSLVGTDFDFHCCSLGFPARTRDQAHAGLEKRSIR